MEEQRRYCLYARKSTESDEHQAMSIGAQVQEMTELAERENVQIVDILQESKSAKATGKRVMFLELLKGLETEKYNMGSRIDKFILADNLKPLDFSKADRRGFIEYEKGLFAKNITSRVQELLGVTILHIFTTKDVTMATHKHTLQYQSISVIKGKAFDEESNKLYGKDSSIPISKQVNHTIKYFANSEYIIYFAPSLIPYKS